MSLAKTYKKTESSLFNLNIRVRDALFNPLARLLNAAGITPNFISNFRLFLIVPFVVCFLYSTFWAGIVIAVIIVLDWIDGPLARLQKVASDRGKFVDTFNDTVVMLLTALSVAYISEASVMAIAYFVFIAAIAYVLAIVFRNERKPSDWVIKPDPRIGYFAILYYIGFFLLTLFGIDIMPQVFLILNVAMTVFAIGIYVALQVRWSKEKGTGSRR